MGLELHIQRFYLCNSMCLASRKSAVHLRTYLSSRTLLAQCPVLSSLHLAGLLGLRMLYASESGSMNSPTGTLDLDGVVLQPVAFLSIFARLRLYLLGTLCLPLYRLTTCRRSSGFVMLARRY